MDQTEIWGSQCGEDVHGGLRCCDAAFTCSWLPWFWRNILSPSSPLKGRSSLNLEEVCTQN